jgi:hypothetical protein
MRSDEKPGNPRRSAAKVLSVIFDHVADDMADNTDTELTEADRRWARDEHAQMQSRIAEMRRQHTPLHIVIERAVSVSPEIGALPRAELLARLEAVSHRRAVQYAHRNLTGLTDDDLRQMLAVLETRPAD